MSDHAATLLSELRGLRDVIYDCNEELKRITNELNETLTKELTNDVELLPTMASDLVRELAYDSQSNGCVGDRLSEAYMHLEDAVIYPLEQAMKGGT